MGLISVKETAFCSVTYKNYIISIEFFVLPGSCQPILDGFETAQLKIITMDKNDTLRNPMKLLEGEREFSGEFNFRIWSILEKYTEKFHGLREINDYQVELYANNTVKPTAVPPSTHLIPS